MLGEKHTDTDAQVCVSNFPGIIGDNLCGSHRAPVGSSFESQNFLPRADNFSLPPTRGVLPPGEFAIVAIRMTGDARQRVVLCSLHEAQAPEGDAERAPPGRASPVVQRAKLTDRGGARTGLGASGASCGAGAGARRKPRPRHGQEFERERDPRRCLLPVSAYARRRRARRG
jgi:hypothetical protein